MLTIAGRYRVFFLVMFIFFIGSVVGFSQDKSKSVFVLHSYHSGFQWTDDLTEGILESFRDAGMNNTEFFIEYLDTKRFAFTDGLTENTLSRFSLLYGDQDIDVIITTDNNALHFLLEHRDEYLPGVPAVFCGYNNYRGSLLGVQENITGIVEKGPRFSESLDLITTLQPDITDLYLVSDGSETGVANLREVMIELNKLESTPLIHILSSSDYSYSELVDILSQVPSSSAVFYLDFFIDRLGDYYSPDWLLPHLTESIDVPVYVHVDLYMGNGALGGVMNVGFDHGKRAGEMALKILQGIPADSISLINPAPAQIVLDGNVLQRFNLSTAQLEEPFSIIHPYRNFYTENKQVIWMVLILVLALVLFIVFLMVLLLMRRTGEKKILEREKRFRSIFEGVNEAILILQPDSLEILDVNRIGEGLFGYRKEELKDSNIHKILIEEDEVNRSRLQDFWAAGVLYEGRFLLNEGRVVSLELSRSSVVIEDKSYCLVSVRDISQRYKAQKQIEESLLEKELLLQEVNHRVKNNFQMMTGLISEGSELPEGKLRPFFHETMLRLKSMSLVQELVFGVKHLNRIILSDFFESITRHVVQGMDYDPESIDLIADLDNSIEVGADLATPCGLILNELLINSIKYAFPEGWSGSRELRVFLKREEGTIVFGQSDNGIGMELTDHTESKKYGLTLVQLLAEQIGAEMTVVTRPGCSITIRFQDKKKPASK